MITFIILSSVFVGCFSWVDAQSCQTPSGAEGDCKLIKDCEPLFALFNKASKRPEDKKLLQDSQCGIPGHPPGVCCPKPCYTPEGHEGKCVGLGSCPHIVDLLKNANDKLEAKNYVRNLVCSGPEERSVCCGPPPSSEPPRKVGNCSSVMTAFPPDRRTGCCGVDDSVDIRIVGGNITAVDQYPWLVVIEYIKAELPGEVRLLCGGSLISGKYVLTAAHCVTGPFLNHGTPKNVRLGEFNTTGNGPDCITVEAGGVDCTDGVTTVPIEKTIPHPEYAPFNMKHDIALIRLKSTAPYTHFIHPICLPTRDYPADLPPGFRLFVAGWGLYEQTDGRSGILSTLKLHVEVPYVEREICHKSFVDKRRLNDIGSGQICAGGEPGKDSCNGDSGGPLMYARDLIYEVVGVVSYGVLEKCGTPNVPGVYTYVYEYLPWIRSIIKP